MIAGATTHTSSPIGTVTEAQMARILVKEYCLEFAGAVRYAGSVWVFVMPSASWGRRVQHISRRSRNPTLKYAPPVTRMSYYRMMPGREFAVDEPPAHDRRSTTGPCGPLNQRLIRK